MAPSRKQLIPCTLYTLLFFSNNVLADDSLYSSALSVAASHSSALSISTDAPALPLPANPLDEPGYEAIAQLAAGWPIVQQTAPGTPPDLDAMHESMRIGLNDTSGEEQDLSTRATALRVMIVGDSMTQGQQGDFTWRYRMWQWFQQQQVAVQFVGPYTGTFQSTTALATGTQGPTPPPPLYSGSTTATNESSSGISVNGGYARSVDPNFLKTGGYNHFSNWGRAMATDQGLIAQFLQQYPADLILLNLGFNDMGWFYSDCYGLTTSLQLFIQNARSVNPNMKFAVANVPHRTFIRPDLVSNTTTYNNILPSYIAKFSTAQSPVHLVEFQQNYACGTTNCSAAYDGLHPNAWGEFQIAQAFSKSLIAGFGIGSTPLAIPAQNDPSVVRQIDTPANFKVFSSPQGVSATWDAVYGAYSYDLIVSVNGGGAGYSSGSAVVNRFDSQWPLPGWSYSISVRAACGNQYGGYSNTQSATATPQLAPPPQNINVKPLSDGFTVSFDPPTGPYTNNIVEYNIIYWDTNPTDCQFLGGAAFQSSPATIRGLLPGRSYLVAPLTWNSNGQGLPFGAHNVIPGSTSTPQTPASLKVLSNDPTTVHMTWDASPGAAGYEVFWRNATKGPYISLANVTSACVDDYFLYPGTWNYQFCVAAWNGNQQSPPGSAVIAPSPASTVTAGSPGPTCASPAPWCPGYGVPYNGGYVGGCAGCGGNGGSATVSTAQTTSTTPRTTSTTPRTTTTTPAPTSSCSTTKTASSGTPLIICGTSTHKDPSPSKFSFQARFTGNVAYGDLSPASLAAAISSACTSGCGATTTTTTATIIPRPTVAAHEDTELEVPYVISANIVPDGSYDAIMKALISVVQHAQTENTFEWYQQQIDNNGLMFTTDEGKTTQYHGPNFVQVTRYELDGSNVYTILSGTFSYTVSPYQDVQGISCSQLEGPITAALGALPGVGEVLGVIGAVICAALGS